MIDDTTIDKWLGGRTRADAIAVLHVNALMMEVFISAAGIARKGLAGGMEAGEVSALIRALICAVAVPDHVAKLLDVLNSSDQGGLDKMLIPMIASMTRALELIEKRILVLEPPHV